MKKQGNAWGEKGVAGKGKPKTEDFFKECFWELKRDKASGVDGVTVKEYIT